MVSVCPQNTGLIPCIWLLLLFLSLQVNVRCSAEKSIVDRRKYLLSFNHARSVEQSQRSSQNKFPNSSNETGNVPFLFLVNSYYFGRKLTFGDYYGTKKPHLQKCTFPWQCHFLAEITNRFKSNATATISSKTLPRFPIINFFKDNAKMTSNFSTSARLFNSIDCVHNKTQCLHNTYSLSSLTHNRPYTNQFLNKSRSRIRKDTSSSPKFGDRILPQGSLASKKQVFITPWSSTRNRSLLSNISKDLNITASFPAYSDQYFHNKSNISWTPSQKPEARQNITQKDIDEARKKESPIVTVLPTLFELIVRSNFNSSTNPVRIKNESNFSESRAFKDNQKIYISSSVGSNRFSTRSPDFLRRVPILKSTKDDPEVSSRSALMFEDNDSFENSMEDMQVVGSTYFPHSLYENSVRYGNNDINETDITEITIDKSNVFYQTRLTTEKLAYVLIGTCCAVSIFCLIVVAVTMKCRRICLEKKLKRQFKRARLYGSVPKWQNPFSAHLSYLQNGTSYFLQNSTCSSYSCDSCHCRCAMWTLGPRNLDTKPFCPIQNPYLRGPRKLPFGAASTLRFENLGFMGNRRDRRRHPSMSGGRINSGRDSRHGDSLEDNINSDSSSQSRLCTCVEPNYPPIPNWSGARLGSLDEVERRWRPVESPRRHRRAAQVHQGTSNRPVDMTRNCSPPVTGSNYMDSANGVIFWSSNDERLI